VPFHLYPFFSRHRLQGRDATTLYNIEPQRCANEVQILSNVAASVDALGNDAGKRFSVKARAMKNKTQPVKKALHSPGHLERIVRCGKDHPIGIEHPSYERVPVVLERAELLAA